MSDRFILIHQRFDWQLDLSDWLLDLPGYPTRFMGKLYWVPKYTFDQDLRRDALDVLLDKLVLAAPSTVPMYMVDELRALQRQLRANQLRGEMFELSERKLMMNFGHEKLPKLMLIPEHLEKNYSVPEIRPAARGGFFKWLLVIAVVYGALRYFHILGG